MADLGDMETWAYPMLGWGLNGCGHELIPWWEIGGSGRVVGGRREGGGSLWGFECHLEAGGAR